MGTACRENATVTIFKKTVKNGHFGVGPGRAKFGQISGQSSNGELVPTSRRNLVREQLESVWKMGVSRRENTNMKILKGGV